MLLFSTHFGLAVPLDVAENALIVKILPYRDCEHVDSTNIDDMCSNKKVRYAVQPMKR